MAEIDYSSLHIASNSGESVTVQNWRTGDFPVTTIQSTLLSGETVVAYQALGRVTASGKLVPCVQSAVDGSQNVFGFAVYAVNASLADKPCNVYRTGQFNPAMVVWDASFDTDLKKEAALIAGAPSLFLKAVGF